MLERTKSIPTSIWDNNPNHLDNSLQHSLLTQLPTSKIPDVGLNSSSQKMDSSTPQPLDVGRSFLNLDVKDFGRSFLNSDISRSSLFDDRGPASLRGEQHHSEEFIQQQYILDSLIETDNNRFTSGRSFTSETNPSVSHHPDNSNRPWREELQVLNFRGNGGENTFVREVSPHDILVSPISHGDSDRTAPHNERSGDGVIDMPSSATQENPTEQSNSTWRARLEKWNKWNNTHGNTFVSYAGMALGVAGVVLTVELSSSSSSNTSTNGH